MSTEAARVAAIVGPTAAGKTEASIDVALALGAEIVSMDSMQIYRGMDIGTAKPSGEALERVRHHLVDDVDPDHELTVADFQQRARAAIEAIERRGKVALLVGGSGLYFRAVVDDLRFPPRSASVRSALEAEIEDAGAEALHDRLRDLDPVAATRIDVTNARRIVRALETIELTGQKFSDNDSWERYDSIYSLAVAGVTLGRSELYRRIAARVEEMLAAGLVEEARALDAGGLGATARQALGYRQVLAHADAPAAAIRDEIVRATKRFARRQESWFRADPRIEWFDAAADDLARRLASFFVASLALT